MAAPSLLARQPGTGPGQPRPREITWASGECGHSSRVEKIFQHLENLRRPKTRRSQHGTRRPGQKPKNAFRSTKPAHEKISRPDIRHGAGRGERRDRGERRGERRGEWRGGRHGLARAAVFIPAGCFCAPPSLWHTRAASMFSSAAFFPDLWPLYPPLSTAAAASAACRESGLLSRRSKDARGWPARRCPPRAQEANALERQPLLGPARGPLCGSAEPCVRQERAFADLPVFLRQNAPFSSPRSPRPSLRRGRGRGAPAELSTRAFLRNF